MVNLTRIYTRTGDDGTTSLGDFSRTRKTDPRLVAFADVDEANAAIGVVVALAAGDLSDDALALLQRVQNDLFDVGADLCTPLHETADGARAPLRVTPEYVTGLEEACDRFNADLAPLRSFILPGGTVAAAHLHVARTVVRRAERAVWSALASYGEEAAGEGSDKGAGGINREAAQYLNRLSDLLFILGRVANGRVGDVLWEPGAGHAPPPPEGPA